MAWLYSQRLVAFFTFVGLMTFMDNATYSNQPIPRALDTDRERDSHGYHRRDFDRGVNFRLFGSTTFGKADIAGATI